MSSSSGPGPTNPPMTPYQFERKEETQTSFHLADTETDPKKSSGAGRTEESPSPLRSLRERSVSTRLVSLRRPITRPWGYLVYAAPRTQVNGPILRFKIQKLQIQNFLTLKLYGVFTKQSYFSIN